MIIIFQNKEEASYYRSKCTGSSILRSKYFNSAFFINSYLIGSYITADYVIKELERCKQLKKSI